MFFHILCSHWLKYHFRMAVTITQHSKMFLHYKIQRCTLFGLAAAAVNEYSLRKLVCKCLLFLLRGVFSLVCIHFSRGSCHPFPRQPVECQGHRLWPQRGPLERERNVQVFGFLFPEIGIISVVLWIVLQGSPSPQCLAGAGRGMKKIGRKVESLGVCLVVRQTFHSQCWCF